MHLKSPLADRQKNQVRDLIPALDGVRGFAVLLVLLDHASDSGLRFFPAADFNHAGKYGVFLFFALSAFLLTYPFFLRDPKDILQPRVWANYLLRRFLRIFPLFAIVLIVHAWRRDGFSTTEIWNHLLLREGKGHFWTIPVEFKYYFVLPFLVFAAGWVWRVKGWILGAIACALFYFVFLEYAVFPIDAAWAIGDDVLLYKGIHVFLAGSLAGIVHAWIVRRQFERPWLKPSCEAIALVSLLLMLLLIPAVYNAVLNPGRDVKKVKDMVEVSAVAWPLFLVGLLHGLGWLRRIFSSAALRYLGLISYSAYLWHRIVLGKLDDENPLPQWVRLLAFILSVVVVASISYWVIERPLMRIRLGPRRASLSEGAAAVAS